MLYYRYNQEKGLNYMTYCVATTFETVYTHEIEHKVEYTDDRARAIGAYCVYLENSEVTECYLIKVPYEGYTGKGKMIAAYKYKGL